MMRLVMACGLALLTASPVWSQVDPKVLEAEAARAAVVERASSATVAIFAKAGQGGGSGVVISPDGYALSNFHVTQEAGVAMKCGLNDGKLYDAVIVGLDPTGDVALIKLLGRQDFPVAEMANSDKVRVGDWCFTIGNPFLLATDFQPTVSYGMISGVHRYQYPAGSILEYADCLQADAAINPGNSGGPMFDAEGKLIGINGRGSFEKRGRVNVGVGYAISINQIKNFLGHLKSGRLVDHATLGARMRSDVDRRVLVDDILEQSDAYRRGLRYGDEVVAFGGRDVDTVNAFKNALGIFPKGWRVPLSFLHQGERVDVLVRLRGVHRQAELDEMLAGEPKPEHGPRKPPAPGQPQRDGEPEGEEAPRLPLPPLPGMHPAGKPVPLPEIVQQHYEKKPGYVNYYFNKLNRDRVWNALIARGDYGAWRGVWRLTGATATAEQLALELADDFASIKLPSGQLKIDLVGSLADRRDPPGSGGLLVALSLWRKFLQQGVEKFGEVEYLGTAPLPGHAELMDVLVADHGDIQCQLMFRPTDGQLLSLEMLPEEDTDPCELFFSDYQEVEGRLLPGRVEVRHGDGYQQVFTFSQHAIGTAAAAEKE